MLSRTLRVAAAFLVLVLSGTAAAIVSAPYFPLESGNYWTFLKDGISPHTTQVLPGTYTVNGVATKGLQTSENDISYFTNDASGIRQHRDYMPAEGVTATYSPPIKYAEADQALGAQVSSSGTVQLDLGTLGVHTLNYSAVASIAGFESVSVPAGTFQAGRLSVTVTMTGSIGATPISETETMTFWLVSGLGPVKQLESEGGVLALTGSNLLDQTPAPFSFAPRTGVALGATVESDPVTMSGFNTLQVVVISGGEYSVNGGAWSSGTGQVASGDVVRLRVVALNQYNATQCAMLVVGWTTRGDFCATTLMPAHRPVAFQDFNGDTRDDILWRNSGTGQNALWLMNGSAFSGELTTPVIDTHWEIKGVGDFDGDGQSDILWRNRVSGDTALWLMDGATLRGGYMLSNVPIAWQVAGLGDFDGDGKTDIFWRTAIQTAVWLMNGSAVAATALLPEVPAAIGWTLSGIGDLNADGKADVVWRNTFDGSNAVWYMNGTSLNGAAMLAAVDGDWAVFGVADFNGDAKADLLWRQPSTGLNAIWLMDGSTLTTSALLPTVTADTQWAIAGTGDYDGDGKADILWRNAGTGQNALWLMNGLAMKGAALLADVPDMAWQIVGR